MKTLRNIYRTLFGYKYFAVLIDDGHRDYISSNIFVQRKYAKRFVKELERECRSLQPAGIVSFRAKKELTQLDSELNQ